jgi:hypothetical protein
MATILNLMELQKRPGRIETLLGKLASNSRFETTRGQVICNQLFVYSKDGAVKVYKPKEKKDFEEAAKALKKASVGDSKMFAVANSSNAKAAIPISNLKKTGEFGGKSSDAGLVKENLAVEQLKKSLAEAIVDNHGPITLNMDGKRIPGVSAVRVTANPGVKSDFELVDSIGKPVVWISHKDGSTTKHFQQWGGISLSKEPRIFNHPETQCFLENLRKAYPKGLSSGMTLFRRIKDRNLKMMAVYGNDFQSGTLGEQNVSVTLQGPPCIEKSGQSYTINAIHRHYNGSSLDANGYEPVFMALYSPGRNNGGVLLTRIGIWPISGRKGVEFTTLK